MKPLLFLAFLALTAANIAVFGQDTIYLNRFSHETTAANASYYRTRTRVSDGWQVTDHYLNGKPQMIGRFSDDSSHIRHGLSTWYDSTGLPLHETEYTDNKENGKDIKYYKGGQLEMTGTYKTGKRDGDFVAYYPSGKLSGMPKPCASLPSPPAIGIPPSLAVDL